MKSCSAIRVVALVVLATACSHQPSTLAPPDAGTATQAPSFVPRASETNGVSPTHALADTIIPRGTEVVVRLESTLSSNNSHPGDSFTAIVDKPITVKGEVLIPRGAKVDGRVVSVHAANGHSRAFLRLTLSSVQIAGKTVAVHTSAVFAKGVLPSSDPVSSGIASGVASSDAVDQFPGKSREVEFSTGRVLIFWLVQASPL